MSLETSSVEIANRTTDQRVPASFRDPSGWVFRRGDILYRRVNAVYQEHYRHLMDSGCYHTLVEKGLLVAHSEVEPQPDVDERAYKILRPEVVPFISYPYEWCFSQLQDAALTTLRIQRTALEFGLELKDASAYNIQFRKGKPIFIDTLSFQLHQPGRPWVAYRQFCQHFLAPLAIMSYVDLRLGQLCREYLDGVPLELASRILPTRTVWKWPLLVHIHLHGKSQQHLASNNRWLNKVRSQQMQHEALLGILDNLEAVTAQLRPRAGHTVWEQYKPCGHYASKAYTQKEQFVAESVRAVSPREVWDMGANTGSFSRIAAAEGARVMAYDADPYCVEVNYRSVRDTGSGDILPLVMDLTNSSPGLGWNLNERMALTDRGPADMVLALALVHHLAFGHNIPLESIARFFARAGRVLVIEFVPREDPMSGRLLMGRETLFEDYTQQNFEKAFKKVFDFERTVCLADSTRILYLMRRRNDEN